METAIRWNQRSTHTDPSFLIVDVIGRTFKHCRVTDASSNSLKWQEISRNSRAPGFRAFDWNFSHNVVAIGQWSGEANVLRLDNESESLSLPIKSQRQCNAVAFNPETLLATGLERVRNDFCLNVYDILHWAGGQASNGLLPRQPAHEPIRKLATSEGITSIKFFQEEPNVLVAGVKGTCVRIYDLRDDGGNPAMQYNTTCVHNIAVDPCDSNYFASAGPVKDSTVQIWDRRSAAKPPATAPPSAIQFTSLDTPLLELKDVFRYGSESEAPSVWSLRYSIAEPGSIGVLGSNGSVRIFETKRSYEEVALDKAQTSLPDDDGTQAIYVNRTETLGRPLHRPRRGSKATPTPESSERVLAFDFINVLSCSRRSSAIAFYGTQEIGLRELHPKVPAIAASWRNAVAVNGAPEKARRQRRKGSLKGLAICQAPQKGTIVELRSTIKARLEASDKTNKSRSPITPSADGWYKTEEDINDGWKEQAPSAQSSPSKADAKDAFLSVDRRSSLISIQDALVLVDTYRRRCMEGYLLDASKNSGLVREETELRWMWDWIKTAKENAADDKLVMNDVDFSYFGIQNVWDSSLGSDPSPRLRRPSLNMDVSKIIVNLVNSLDLPEIELPRTGKSYQRRLCLYMLGFDPTPDVLLTKVKSLALAGRNSEGALHALLAGDSSLASIALRSGPRQSQNKALSLLLSLYSSNSDRSSLLSHITAIGATEKDPFSLGILALLTSQTTTAPPSLPPTYQLGLALKSLPDAALRSYFPNALARATSSGLPSYLPLTGLTHLSIPLFQRYLSLTSDLQSVVLALAHASPLYFRHPLADAWRAEYRTLLNRYGLHIKRAQFDMQSTKLATAWDGRKALEPQRRQVSLKCGNCDGPLHREREAEQPGGEAKAAKPLPSRPGHRKEPSQTGLGPGPAPQSPMLVSRPSDLSTRTVGTTGTAGAASQAGQLSAESSFSSTLSDASGPLLTTLPFTPAVSGSGPGPGSGQGPTSAPMHPPPLQRDAPPQLPSANPPPSAPSVAASLFGGDSVSASASSSDVPAGPAGSAEPVGPVGPPAPRVFGGPRDGTMCPHCGARMPRCAVCDFWVGEVDPRSKGGRAKAVASVRARENRREREREREGARLRGKVGERKVLDEDGEEREEERARAEMRGEGGGSEDDAGLDEDSKGDYGEDENGGDGREDFDAMEGFIEICLSCRHLYHRRHAKEWFRRHEECAVVGCRCPCGTLDGGFVAKTRGGDNVATSQRADSYEA